jgi:hypothetical protein
MKKYLFRRHKNLQHRKRIIFGEQNDCNVYGKNKNPKFYWTASPVNTPNRLDTSPLLEKHSQ